jgi:hypothetical protein
MRTRTRSEKAAGVNWSKTNKTARLKRRRRGREACEQNRRMRSVWRFSSSSEVVLDGEWYELAWDGSKHWGCGLCSEGVAYAPPGPGR